MRDGGEEGRREVAVLRVMDLFDRPADSGCLKALLQAPVIPGLTEPLVGLAGEDWEFCLPGLEAAKLLTVNRDATRSLVSLDAHPHLREYFANQLRDQSPAPWRAAHRRLYEHLCATTPDKAQPRLEDLQPLYQAVAHGCLAGLHSASLGTFKRRIHLDREGRKDVSYSTVTLGLHGHEVAVLSGFFQCPWHRTVEGLSPFQNHPQPVVTV